MVVTGGADDERDARFRLQTEQCFNTADVALSNGQRRGRAGDVA